jgi:hypothetical protein
MTTKFGAASLIANAEMTKTKMTNQGILETLDEILKGADRNGDTEIEDCHSQGFKMGF